MNERVGIGRALAELLELQSGDALDGSRIETALESFAHRWMRILTIEEKWRVSKKLAGNRQQDAALMLRMLDTLAEGVWNESRRR